ncbi:TPA: hypothetical protein R6805_004502 [Klebsiella pneumoniae]|uniref:hypothetical protein n=1 Tax=Klebsiella pneumoniae TaxID=573 RepID=UPI002243D0AA|nr:hypothetical protein [Klebsiella pneumoniae]HEE1616992.1 hypothetical protein [Klebsiella pneumoniae]
MAKPAKIDFATENAQTIADAILNGVTNIQNLKAFRYRVGTDKADKLYPQTREAMNLVNAERKKARDRQVFKDLLRPFSQKYAAGATLTQILSPVLEGYRQMFLDKFGLDLRPEQIIMMIVATDGVEKLQKAGYPLIGDFPTSCN